MKGVIPAPPTAESVGARPDTWMPTAEDVGAQPAFDVLPVAQGGTGKTSALESFFALAHRGNVPGDADLCTSAGIYMYIKDTANIPTGTEYGVIITIISDAAQYNGTSNWMWQIALSTNFTVFIRQKINNAAFTAWAKIL